MMKKSTILKAMLVCTTICIAFSSFAQNKSPKEIKAFNIYLYHNFRHNYENDYHRKSANWNWKILDYIPLYGVSNAKLTLKIYPTTDYFDRKIKATEHPEAEFFIEYSADGRLVSVKENGSESISFFQYYEDGYLARRSEYNTLTGETVKRYDFSNKPFYTNGESYDGFSHKGLYCTVSDDAVLKHYITPLYISYPVIDGWQAYIYAYGYKDGVYQCCYERSIKMSKSRMKDLFGTGWHHNTTNYGYGKKVVKKIDLNFYSYDTKNYNEAGLLINLFGNISASQLKSVVSDDKYYEYVWSVPNSDLW